MIKVYYVELPAEIEMFVVGNNIVVFNSLYNQKALVNK